MQNETANLPSISELYDDVVTAQKQDVFTVLLNQEPNQAWIKTHPFISGYKYIPIERVEFLLKKIFKAYRIEVMKSGMLMNAVEVTVRVHYLHPITNEWNFHDGVGAQELQTQKGTGPLKMDMSNVNSGAVTMALPIAKTIAIKDACDHFGKLFGSDLNRKTPTNYTIDQKLHSIDLDLIKSQVKL
jgi:hypothetical protein